MKTAIPFILSIIISLNTHAQSWNCVLSLPNFIFTGLDFPVPDTGYVVGNHYDLNGAIFKTTDGGNSFTQIYGTRPPPFTIRLHDIYFVDANYGFAVGDSGLILKTADGGTTWNHQLTGISEDFWKVYFINHSIGFALGGTPLRTTDGGANWSPLTIGNNTTIINDIDFGDNNVGYFTRYDSIFKTIDAGNNWNGLPYTLVSVTEIEFPTPLIGYGNFRGMQVSFLAKTIDGGITWTELDSTLVTQSPYWFRDMEFLNKDTGYMVRRDAILLTKDGGLSWHSNKEIGDIARKISFADAQTGYIIGVSDYLQQGSHVFKTTNGGGVFIEENPTMPVANQIFPNPTVAFAHFGGLPPELDWQDMELLIFDISGRLQKKLITRSSGSAVQINLEGFRKGVYFIHLALPSGETLVRKVVKL